MTRHPAHTIPFDTLLAGLQARQQQGLIHRQEGPHSLSLWTYSRTCQYESKWDPITIVARGLILHEATRRIVATPFPKFFNHGEITTKGQWGTCADEVTGYHEPYEVFAKMDGSLIILFHWEGEWHTCTKGSFYSEQAKWAKAQLANYNTSFLEPGITYLLEAIYPENRIVVNYLGARDLHLLSAYWGDGEEVQTEWLKGHAKDLNIPMAGYLIGAQLPDLIERAKTLPADEEGWVVRFANGHRIKIKGEAYLRLHRCIAGVTPLNIWRAMRDNADLDVMRRDVPEEFHKDFDAIRKILEGSLQYWCDLVMGAVYLAEDWSDRELAARLHILPEKVRKYVFTVRRGGLQAFLSHPVNRSLFLNNIRPTSNRLLGYFPSSSMQRVQEEAV